MLYKPYNPYISHQFIVSYGTFKMVAIDGNDMIKEAIAKKLNSVSLGVDYPLIEFKEYIYPDIYIPTLYGNSKTKTNYRLSDDRFEWRKANFNEKFSEKKIEEPLVFYIMKKQIEKQIKLISKCKDIKNPPKCNFGFISLNKESLSDILQDYLLIKQIELEDICNCSVGDIYNKKVLNIVI